MSPPGSVGDLIEQNRQVLRRHAIDRAALGEPEVILRGTVVNVTTSDQGPPLTGRFLARDFFRDHIELVAGGHGPGVYVDVLAGHMGISPGDVFTFTAGSTTSQVEVQAVYAGLYDRLDDPYWCSVEDLLEPKHDG